jgi:hypothetical protein
MTLVQVRPISLIRKKSDTTQNYHFSGEAIQLLYFLIRVFKIEELKTSNTYVGKKGILQT